MSSPRELVAELEEIGRGAWAAAIILAAGADIDFLFCPPTGPPGVLLELEGLVAAGWRPIGFLRVIESKASMNMVSGSCRRSPRRIARPGSGFSLRPH